MARTSWIVGELLRVTTDYFKEKGIESPRLTAEILLAHQLKTNRIHLYLNLDQPLTENEISGFRTLVRRRVHHEPLQYITGTQEFWSLDFLVDQRVLIPRPETELLVEQAVGLAEKWAQGKDSPLRILDLGTGCGALAISLAKEFREAEIWASDFSTGALDVARLNARRHGVSDRIVFRYGNLFEPVKTLGIPFDMVVSNPPYIPHERYNQLAPEIRDFEPRVALDGRKGGMFFIEEIFRAAPRTMNPGGWILIEMDPDQTERALSLIAQMEEYEEKGRVKDYSQRYRMVLARTAKAK